MIECNLRASRSFPFVSKVMRVNFIDIAAAVMMGRPVPVHNGSATDLEYVGVKAPQFSFTRLDGADPVLGVEMASTGEVGCLGDDFEEAFLKALLSVGFRVPVKSVLLSTGPIADKAAFQTWVVDYHRANRFALIVPPTECTLIPLHEIRDQPALADALDTLILDAPLRERMGEAANRWVRTSFSVEAMRKGTIDVYRSLM